MVGSGGAASVADGGIRDTTHASTTPDDFVNRNDLHLDFDSISSHESHQHHRHHHHHSNTKPVETGNNAVECTNETATTKPKATRKRKGPRAQSLEEVFATISSVRSSGLNAPPEHLVLTPRSAEACLRCGVNPETLKIRDLESFYDADVVPAVQRMRHEAYSMRRHEEMKAVRLEKKKIIETEDAAVESLGPARASAGRHRHQPHGRTHSTSKAASSVSPSPHSSPEKSESKLSMVDVEKKRLEKLKARQERELEQMLDFELKMSRIQQDAAEKAERERRLSEQRERERVRFAQEMAEEKRQRELKKRAQLDAEEERRKLLAAEMAQRDRELAEHKAKLERLRRVEAREREEERKAKADEHRLAAEEVARQQALEVAARLEELDVAEKARNDMVEQQRLERAREMEARRRVVTLRVRKNLTQSKKLERQRKRELTRKQLASEQLRQEHEAELERQREFARRQHETLERKRLLVLEDAKRDDARKKAELLQRQRDVERNVHDVQETQQQQLALKKEYRRIQQQLKLDKVERMKRIQEYKRLETLRKLQDTEQRTQAMLDEKDSLVKRRKQIAVHAKIQRDLILRTMETVKITKKWTQASKTIEQVLGKTASPSPSPSPTRSPTRSVAGRPKSSAGAITRQTSLPTITRPHTPSAGVQSRVFRPPSPPPTRTAFRFTREAQEEEARGRSGGPQSYLSPYDQVPEQIRSKKLAHVRSSVL